MSAFAIRKNNIGRALVRFLIGAVIIAALVIMIKEFWLKKSDTPKDDVTGGLQTAENTVTDTTPLSLAGQEDEIEPVQTAQTLVGDDEGTDEPENAPDDYEGDENEGIFGDDEGESDESGDFFTEIEFTPTPTPTGEPTPTPAPAATAVPANLYAQRITKGDAVTAKWLTDKESRINHNIVEFNVLPSVNGGNVISLVGWSYGTYNMASRGWNGKNNTTYIYVTNEKKQAQYYPVTIEAGVSGVAHTTTGGQNMDMADFTCVIDVSSYPNGTYTLGSCNYFTITHNGTTNKFHHGYTFGSGYSFTVVDGFVTAVGGYENN